MKRWSAVTILTMLVASVFFSHSVPLDTHSHTAIKPAVTTFEWVADHVLELDEPAAHPVESAVLFLPVLILFLLAPRIVRAQRFLTAVQFGSNYLSPSPSS